jgi:transcriptional regulator with XRE-family HTH domain
MTLKEWLKLQGLSIEEFAGISGYSVQAIYSWIRGDRFPRPSTMKNLMKLTNNKLDVSSFLLAKQN